MNTQLKCLVVEDDPLDFQLLEHHLRQAAPGAHCRRVDRLADFQAALAEGGWDAVLSDYIVPGLDFRDTLAWLQSQQPGLPLILVSGTIGEEQAVEMLKLGVSDIVLKDNLRRLVPAIERSLNDAAGQRARLAAEDRYRSLFDNMLNGCAHGRVIFEDDQPRDFIYLAVNPAFEKLTGRKGVVGLRLTEVVPELLAGNPQFFEPYGRVVRTGIPEKYESYIVALQQWFAVALYRTAPDEFMAVFDIITERKQAEESLRRSQAVYHSLVNQLPAGIYQKDHAGRYVVVNPTLCQLRGLPAAAFLGKSALEVARAENSKPGPGALAWEAALVRENHHGQIMQSGQPIELEEEFIQADGRRESMHVVKLPVLDLAGQVIGTQGVLFNITARKQAEAALQQSEEFKQAILDSVTSHIAVLDSKGVILAVNERWQEFARANPLSDGALPPQTGPGANYLAICGASGTPDARDAHAGIMDVIAGRQERFTLEYACHSPREKRWFAMEVTRLGAGPQVVVSHTNITERKQSEELLRASRATLDAALASMADAVFISDVKGEFLEFNQAFATFHKFRNKSECARHLADYPAIIEVFLPNGEPAPLEMWTVPRALRGETVANAEYTIRRKDTGETWACSCSFSPIRGAEGEIIGAVVVARDITERKRAEHNLRLTQFTIEHSSDAIWWLGPDGRFLLANQAASRLVGYSLDEIQTLYAHDLNPAHPPAAWAEHWEELRRKKVLKFEAPARTKDGRLLTMEVTANYLEFEGQEFNCAFVHDITERKARTAELLWKTAFLEALVHSSADGILVVDNQQRQILQNQKVIDLWRIPAEIAANPGDRRQFEFARDQVCDPERFEAHFRQVQANPEEPFQDEIELKNGTILDRHTAPVRGQDGRIYGRLWTFHNITRARQLEAQYRQAQKLEAIGTLAGGIAHDFNNILCSMFGYAYLAQQEIPGQPRANEYLEEILKAANRAKDLVQQILTFSRQREQKREVISLGSVLKEAAKFLRASLPADLQVEIDLDEEAPAVLADPTQIYQVIMNLATNALHAMEGRPGRLVITLAAFQPDEGFRRAHPKIPAQPYTRLTVADTGHGMDARTLEHIFEPFFTTKAVGKGTGLGLAVVHGIVQAHEGFITVASRPGEGTQFDLYFPAQTEAVLPLESPAGNIPRGQGERILLLDDELALTGPFKGLLERLNYKVTTFNLASEALRGFRDNPAQFDLVITDLTMPEISGLEVARQLHAIRADLPVILATGYGYSLSAATLKEAGITQILEKPLVLATLASAVQRALTTRK